MFKDIYRQFRTALLSMVLLAVLTGFIYPIVVTAIAQFFFPNKANGSAVTFNGKIIGSKLIGQYFNDPKYFWGRPSMTVPVPYDPTLSAGSNLGPMNPRLIDNVKNYIEELNAFDSTVKDYPIPVDLVTSSSSGLDPDISPLAAYYQIHRVAKSRHVSDELIRKLVSNNIETRQFMILGEPRINVLKLNLALDAQLNPSIKSDQKDKAYAKPKTKSRSHISQD